MNLYSFSIYRHLKFDFYSQKALERLVAVNFELVFANEKFQGAGYFVASLALCHLYSQRVALRNWAQEKGNKSISASLEQTKEAIKIVTEKTVRLSSAFFQVANPAHQVAIAMSEALYDEMAALFVENIDPGQWRRCRFYREMEHRYFVKLFRERAEQTLRPSNLDRHISKEILDSLSMQDPSGIDLERLSTGDTPYILVRPTGAKAFVAKVKALTSEEFEGSTKATHFELRPVDPHHLTKTKVECKCSFAANLNRNDPRQEFFAFGIEASSQLDGSSTRLSVASNRFTSPPGSLGERIDHEEREEASYTQGLVMKTAFEGYDSNEAAARAYDRLVQVKEGLSEVAGRLVKLPLFLEGTQEGQGALLFSGEQTLEDLFTSPLDVARRREIAASLLSIYATTLQENYVQGALRADAISLQPARDGEDAKIFIWLNEGAFTRQQALEHCSWEYLRKGCWLSLDASSSDVDPEDSAELRMQRARVKELEDLKVLLGRILEEEILPQIVMKKIDALITARVVSVDHLQSRLCSIADEIKKSSK